MIIYNIKQMKSISKNKFLNLIVVILLTILLPLWSFGCNFNSINNKIKTNNIETATLKQVIDGDTLDVYINNRTYRIRLIGINAEESVNPDKTKNTIKGQESSLYLKNKLKSGSKVWLEKDISEYDKYDRLLRYVWIERPSNEVSYNEFKEKMLNAIIVTDKQAKPAAYNPDTKYSDWFNNL